MSELALAFSAGGAGGAKKLKNESVGTVFLMTRVCLVSGGSVLGLTATKKLTLVALLLRLDAHRQVLAGLPVDLVTLGVVVDEVAAVAVLLAVEVRLGQQLVGEELVLGELEDQAEARLVEVLHADVD